jgi:acetyl esterase/lipase
MNLLRLAGSCLVLIVAPAFAAEAKAPVGEAHTYKRVGDRELKLYVVRPADWKPTDRRPAIVFFHGGGWTGGSPNQFNEHSTYFASRGLVCIQVQYRLLTGEPAATPEACIHDARSAMRWVRARAAEFGLDPQRIAAGGGSAGGHLAAHVGLVDRVDGPTDDLKISPKPAALLLFNPVLDNGPGGWGTARVRDRFPEFSPAHNVSRDDPPAVVFLGTKDNLIPVATMERFKSAMTAVGVRCDLHLYEGAAHGFFNHRGADGGAHYALTVRAADKFLASLGWLKGEPTLAAPTSPATP